MAKYSSYDPQSTLPFRISRSKVQLYLDCPRCFYLDVRCGIKRPAGFPFNLNSAVDTLLKKEFDIHRKAKTQHPYIKLTGLNAIPYQHENLETWRSNFKGISFVHKRSNFETFGAVDDLWINLDTEEIIVVDYKATSKANEVTIDEEWQKSYKNQMEFYQWLLRQNGFKVAKRGWFVYCNGIKDKEKFEETLSFTIKIIPYDGDDSWIEPTLLEIKSLLNEDHIPTAKESCEYCSYVKTYQITLKSNSNLIE